MDAEGPPPNVLLADKGYDADFIRQDMEKRGGTAMIPTKRNRLIQLPVDAAIDALRNMIERCFNKLKTPEDWATRYDKTAHSCLSFIHIVSIRLRTRQFVNASWLTSRPWALLCPGHRRRQRRPSHPDFNCHR